ncbi:MAG: SdrD B-like domain-containing protein, partial [Chloroflexales bacterium]
MQRHYPHRSLVHFCAGSWHFLLALLALLLTLMPVHPALAASAALKVTLSTSFPVVNSGDWAVVKVNYSCSSLGGTATSNCQDVVITSVIPPELARGVGDVLVIGVGTTVTTSYITSTNTARWVFTNPIPPGDSATFELRVRFAPGSTPNNTVALLRAEITGSNAPPNVSNLLPITALATPRARADKRFVSGGVLDLPTVYKVEVCVPNAESGALNLPTLVMTDTLPVGARFDSASDGGVYNPATGTITWPATNILVSNGETCALRTVTVTFTDAVFDVGNEVQNDLTATATALGGAVLTVTDSDIRLIQPPTPGLEFGKSGPSTAEISGTVRYDFTQRNVGTTPLTDLSLVDQIPPEVQVSRIYMEANNLTNTLRLQVAYTTNLTSTWQTLAGSPFTTGTCVNVAPRTGTCAGTLTLGTGEYITALRWTYLDALPYQWATSGNENGFEATVISAPINQIIVNTGESRYTFNGYAILDSSTARTRVVENLPGARPSVGKSATPSDFIPVNSREVTYTLSLENVAFRSLTTPLASPQIVDLLAPELLYVPGSQTMVVTPTGATAPLFELVPNFQGTGRTLLRWSWPGYSLAAGGIFKVQFHAHIAPFTGAGQIPNTAYLAGWVNNPDDLLLSNCSQTSADTYDFDGDGNTQERICSSTLLNVALDSSAKTASLKLVKGQLDSVWTNDPDTGLTVPGGRADYTLTISNSGTIAVKDLVLVDILPWEDPTGVMTETGVVRFNEARETKWRPFLVAPILGPSGSTVYYSTERNPCRQPDLGLDPDAPDCVPANWRTTPPADLSTVQAFKIDFGSLVLSPDDEVTLGVRMRAPYDGFADEIAWNSFAYRAREVGTNNYLLVAEPPRVGIERHDASPPGYGNFVWLDLSPANDLQDSSEPGVNGVRVELFRDDDGTPGPSAGDTFVDETVTGPHDDGRPGFYLFSEPALVPPGAYYARFTPPPGYSLVTPHVGGDDTVDSDVDLITRFTPVTTLISGGIDLSWDAGIRTDTAVGNYVWLDQNQNGLQDEATSAGINGVTVRLHRASDSSVISTTVTADDLRGLPGYYVFEGLTPGEGYYVEFIKPTGFDFTTVMTDTTVPTGTIDSDADTTTGYTSIFTPTIRVYDATRDAGLTQPANILRLGNLVWRDLNNNGRFDLAAGEYGINGVRLDLYRDTNGNNQADPGENIGTTTTASRLGQAGWYQFENLAADDYIVTLDASNFAPNGVLFGLRTSTGNEPTLDPDNNRNNDDNGDLVGSQITSQAITLSSGGEPASAVDGDDTNGNQTLDFGLTGAASLGNYVWFDSNGNGIQNSGEPPVAGITVTLLDGLGTTVLTTTTTDSYGTYGFGELSAGTYRVRFSGLPTGYSFTTRDQGSDDALDSDPDPADGTTDVITLTLNQADLRWDAGLVGPRASIGDLVWDDQDRDGVQDAGEPGLGGVTVKLYASSGTLIISTTTLTTTGFYSFTNIVPGDYYLVFGTLPTGYTPSPQNIGSDDSADSDADVVTYRTAVTSLAAGENDPSWDFGLFTFSSLGNRVWNDYNLNGVQDPGESGVSDVAVRLYRPGSSSAVASTTSDATGVYTFARLVPGDYYIEFSLPSGYRPSQRDAGSDDALDSDPNSVTFQTISTTLDLGENDTSWDFGIYPTASIGDRVWLDNNANGVQDAGETAGVPGVQVVLYDSGGNSINSTVSQASGSYTFTNLVPGVYSLGFILPLNYMLSPQDVSTTTDLLDSDVSSSTLSTITTTLDPGENDPSWDIGLYQPSSLGDRVWHDQNANGVQDGSEPGLDGVAVRLYDSTNTLISSTTTVGGGFYRFRELSPRDYYLAFDLPAGYTTVSPQNSALADSATDSDVYTNTLRTRLISLASSTTDLSWDMGVYNLSSLGDRVWLDDNADGVQNLGETSNVSGTLTGLPVQLWRMHAITPTLTLTTTTDASGYYSFTNLTPGDYYLIFQAPTGYAITRQNQGADTADSDASPLGGQTSIVSLASGVNDPTWDVGLFTPAAVGDLVWLDANANGVQDTGETVGVAGVRVELLLNSVALDYTYTDNSGVYSFTNLLPTTNYQVRFGMLPADHYVSPLNQGSDPAADSDAASPLLTTAAFTLTSGLDDRRYDLGLYQYASVGDFVWHDQNGDGIQDSGEPGIGGATVELYTSGGTLISTTTTLTPTGFYSFTNVVPGDYYVQFAMPTGYDAVSPRNAVITTTTDSDVYTDSLRTATTSLSSGENDPSWDMGVYRYASLGDFVWEDQNGDGVQDATEPGVAGVTVELWRDGASAALSSTTTLATGYYTFTHLDPGAYYVRFAPTAPYTLTYANITASEVVSATDTNDSDALQSTGVTSVTVLVSGESDPTWDAGLYRPASIGDLVWNDADGDGIQNGGETGFDVVTVTVRLLGAGRDRIFGTLDDTSVLSSTDATGTYSFTNLVPGLYQVEFTRPTGYAFTKGDQVGTDATDSDLPEGVAATATTTVTALVSNEDDPTWDVGLYRLLSLGNLVWNDLNDNGLYESASESGISGVTVELYRDTDTNGSYDVVTDTFVVSTTTGATGLYTFTDLLQGDYLVVLPASNFAAGQPLANFRSSDTTIYEPAPDPDTNTDNDDNGTTLASGAVASTAVSLKPSAEPPANGTDGDADTYTNLSVDFGFYSLSLGNRVWDDANNDGLLNNGELGLNGVTVRLYYDTNGNHTLDITETTPLATQTTSNNGAYRFTGLRHDGHYLVEVVPPANYASSTGTNGAATGPYEPGHDAETTTTDSDDNGTTSGAVIRSVLVTLTAAGEPTGETDTSLPTGVSDPAADASSNLTVDFGLFQPLSLGNLVWYDLDNSSTVNGAEVGLSGVAVELYRDTDANGSYDVLTDTFVVSTTTNATGLYSFTNLLPGDYLVRVTAPAGLYSSKDGPNALTPDLNNDSDDNGEGVGAVVASRALTLGIGQEPLFVDDGDGANGNLTLDFGFTRPVSLGNRVFYDTNNDGSDDDGGGAAGSSTGVSNVTVQLFLDLNGDGSLTGNEQLWIAEQTTDATGFYSFTAQTRRDGTVLTDTLALFPATYIVGIAPSNFASGGALAGYHSSGTSISNAGALTETAAPTTDIDRDDNGFRTALAFYLGGVLSPPFAVTVDGEPTTEPEDAGTAPTGDTIRTIDSNLTIDFGFYSTNFGNLVWVDDGAGGGTTLNGVRDGAEAELAGATVTLWSQSNATQILVGADGILGTADDGPAGVVTPASGAYAFAGLPAGQYRIHVVPPAGYASTRDTAASTANPDGNLNDDDNGVGVSTGTTSSNAFTMTAGLSAKGNNLVTTTLGLTTDPTLDFGLVRHYSLGNLVWEDTNNNGLRDAGELGVANVTLRLYQSDAITRAVGLDGANVPDQTTDADGFYRFDNLPAGDYVVTILASNFSGTLLGFASSTGISGTYESALAHDPDDDVNDDDNGFYSGGVISSLPVTLGEGSGTTEPLTDTDSPDTLSGAPNDQSNRSVDFGVFRPLTLGNLVWDDANNDGVVSLGETGLSTVTVRLYAQDGTTEILVGPDGILGTADDAAGGVQTDLTGQYRFTGLLTGTYVAEVAAPDGYTSSSGNFGVYEPTPPDVDTDTTDGDDNGGISAGSLPALVTVRSLSITLAFGGEPTGEPALPGTLSEFARDNNSNLTADFGLFRPLSLGNLVWNDLNNDGAVSGGEPGLSGVPVRLYRDLNSDGTPDILIRTTATNASGHYLFTGLGAGDYIVEIDTPLGMTSSTGQAMSPPFEPGKDAGVIVADNDDNGSRLNATTTRSLPVTLLFNTEPISETLTDAGGITDVTTPDSSANDTVDFGFYTALNLGNLVWEDGNNDGSVSAGETGLANVTVRLYRDNDADGIRDNLDGVAGLTTSDAVLTTTTDATGVYTFSLLSAGRYIVEVTSPAGYRSSTGSINPPYTYEPPPDVDLVPTNNDDNGEETGGVVLSLPIDLSVTGEPDTVTDGDGTNGNLTVDFGFFQVVNLGNLVFADVANYGTYDPPADTPLMGATVELFLADGTTAVTDASNTTVLSQTTGATGIYSFTNLRPGAYRVRVTAPGGYYSSSDGPDALTPDGNVDNDDNGVGMGPFAM